MSPSSKFVMRRGRHSTPRICRPPPPPPILPPGPWPRNCSIDPPEVWFYPNQEFYVSGFACCVLFGDVMMDCTYTCTAGSWSNTTPQSRNCTGNALGIWTAPTSGDCSFSITFTWPDTLKCTASAPAHDSS